MSGVQDGLVLRLVPEREEFLLSLLIFGGLVLLPWLMQLCFSYRSLFLCAATPVGLSVYGVYSLVASAMAGEDDGFAYALAILLVYWMCLQTMLGILAAAATISLRRRGVRFRLRVGVAVAVLSVPWVKFGVMMLFLKLTN